jgi:hypothetical protein
MTVFPWRLAVGIRSSLLVLAAMAIMNPMRLEDRMQIRKFRKTLGIVALLVGILILIPGLYFVIAGPPEKAIYSAPAVIFFIIGGINVSNRSDGRNPGSIR